MSYVSRRNWKRRSGNSIVYKKNGRIVKNFILFFLILFAAHELLSSMLISSYIQQSISMEPTITSGARVLVSPVFYGPEIPFTNTKLPGFRKPKRGDLVICSPEYHPETSWYENILDSGIRFFTLQKKGFGANSSEWISSRMMKRIIGVPGDTIKIDDFEVMIKPKGKQYFFSEFEIMQMDYQTESYPLPEKMPENAPMSGNMNEITLGENQYFVLGDNRSMSNDSYYWGPIGLEDIHDKVVLQYTPGILLLQ